MIILCDIICKSISHEKVNSGFLYTTRLTYPDEKIILFAHKTHIESLKSILQHDGVVVDNIEYQAVKFSDNGSVFAFIQYLFVIKSILQKALKLDIHKIFFLSFSPQILYIIKKLKQKKRFASLKFLMVLHGDFENIRTEGLKIDEKDEVEIGEEIKRSLRSRLLSNSISSFAKKLTLSCLNKVRQVNNKLIKNFGRLFNTKQTIQLDNSDDYRYLALAPYIIDNAKDYLDLKTIKIYPIILPTIFSPVLPKPINTYPIFAIFGFGKPEKLKRILKRLRSFDLNKKFTLKIIGMNTIGLENLSNVECPSPGKRLSRKAMENEAKDVDMFLNLYTRNEYRLSCSNSILEALSYVKPIVHFNNDCINFFNNRELPIGICCDDDNQFVITLAFIINNYEHYHTTLDLYRNNIITLRDKYSISKLTNNLRDAFSWN